MTMSTSDDDTRNFRAGTEVYGSDGEKIGTLAEAGPNYLLVQKGWVEKLDTSVLPNIKNLQDAFEAKIIPGLKAAIPNVGYAVAKFEDFPVSPFGYDGSYSADAKRIVVDRVSRWDWEWRSCTACCAGPEPATPPRRDTPSSCLGWSALPSSGSCPC